MKWYRGKINNTFFSNGMALVVSLGLLLGTLKSHAQTGVDIFQGVNNPAAFSLVPIGSGSIKTDTNVTYSGTLSFNITTQGYYQGGGVALGQPVDLAPYLTNPDAYLTIAVYLPNTQGGGMGFPGGGGYPGSFGPPGGFPGAPGAFPGAPGGFPGFPGYGSGRLNTSTQKAVLRNFRIELVTSNGHKTEALLPLSYASQNNNWYLLSIPVSALPGLSAGDAKIAQIRLFGDAPASFYVGRIAVIVDQSPVSGLSLPEQIVGADQMITYSVAPTAGVRPLRIWWDWGTSPGLTLESEGRTVQHAYYTEGDYTATVVAMDPYTGRILAKSRFSVHVHQ